MVDKFLLKHDVPRDKQNCLNLIVHTDQETELSGSVKFQKIVLVYGYTIEPTVVGSSSQMV